MTRVALAIAVMVLCGCDPGWRIEGSVVDPPGEPIEAASLSLTCPGGQSPSGDRATTDAAGRFSFGGVSGSRTSASCSITITKAGFATKTVAATAVCHRSTETGDFTEPCDPTRSVVTLSR
jgi:hypothetical protein